VAPEAIDPIADKLPALRGKIDDATSSGEPAVTLSLQASSERVCRLPESVRLLRRAEPGAGGGEPQKGGVASNEVPDVVGDVEDRKGIQSSQVSPRARLFRAI
jgi:hypothetical protein